MKTLIIGGTGTLGNEVAKQLFENGHHVTIFSRDELKQSQMRKMCSYYKYIVGDVRDREAVFNATRGMDMVYLFAALKHVSTGENDPVEVYKTNVLGCMNVIASCKFYDTGLTFSSTDKAMMPINAYGASKMMAEKILLSQKENVNVRIARYGNVLGSRGSVLDYFVKCAKEKSLVNITDEKATRFWIKIEDAAKFVLNCEQGLNVPNIKSSKVIDLAKAVYEYYGVKFTKKSYINIGLTPGEKLHESLSETLHSDTCKRYTKKELSKLVESVLK